jgi:hypothetical protein
VNDRTEICETKYRYAYGIDTKDWALYRSIFQDEITMDFSSFSGHPEATMPADTWVSTCRALFDGLDATQHQMSNPWVEIDGDQARCRIYVQAEHFLINDQGDDAYTLGGIYDDRLVRVDGGWQIEAVTLRVLWNRGNRQIMQLALERQR